MALIDHLHSEGFDEGRFSDARGAGDADASGPTGQRKKCLEDRVGDQAVIGARRLGERDGPGQRSPISIADALDEGIGVVGWTGHATGR